MSLGLGVGLAVLAALGLALQALSVRLATLQGRSSDVLLVVILVNAAILVPIAGLGGWNPVLTPTSIAAFVAAGVIGTLFGAAFFYAGIKRIGASRAEPVKASMPLHATILAIIVLGESVSAVQFGGILFIIVGIGILSWEASNPRGVAPDQVTWTGLLFPFAAALFFGLEPIFASIGLAEGTPVVVGLAIKSVAALLAYLAYLSWRGTFPSVGRLRGANLRWYVFAGLASTGFLLAYYAGLTISTVGVVVPIMQTSPLFVVILSAVFLRRIEHITPQVIGTAIIIVIGGIFVATG